MCDHPGGTAARPDFHGGRDILAVSARCGSLGQSASVCVATRKEVSWVTIRRMSLDPLAAVVGFRRRPPSARAFCSLATGPAPARPGCSAGPRSHGLGLGGGGCLEVRCRARGGVCSCGCLRCVECDLVGWDELDVFEQGCDCDRSEEHDGGADLDGEAVAVG